MRNSAIAIVGMAGRFPGARNVDEFWRNLRDGVESIRQLSPAELLAAGVSPDLVARPDYVPAAAVLDGVDMFDASFFGLSPKDAAIMDPQQRHFLECAWEAVENAAHPPDAFAGSIGVFAGCGTPSYLIHNLIHNRRLMESAGLFLIRQTGNDKDVLATRVSYQLDLHGPSLTVQTACSTSLVAVHQACQSLLNCECDMALAGGVTIEIPHAQGYIYREGEILSHDGRCRAFDAASSGTVFSSGVGIVVLRRLDDAIADHDTIHAVILGSAVNNDGRRKAGYLAPSVAGQAEAIGEALGVAGVNAATISYIETHGTGTAVGDPLEIKGLTQAFRGHTDRTGYCAVGSLKTNVGHLDTAAGVAGLIKTALALRHRQLPASLNFQNANPQIDFGATPFYVNTSLVEWKSDGAPRRAGVTALGIGGTNAHVVLEEAPAPLRPENCCPYQIIPLSAQTEVALEAAGTQLAAYLGDHPLLPLADVAFTCQVGRKAFRHRRVVVATSAQDAATLLADPSPQRGIADPSVTHAHSSVVFLFSGQGSQYLHMGADLYRHIPVFRTWLDRCAEELWPHLNLDLRDILLPGAATAGWALQQLNCTRFTQPALFSLEYALAQWWMAIGVRPDAMLGHSIGEYVAACIAGVLSLEDALAITSFRGQLMEETQPGSMLAVALPRAQLDLTANLSLAATNAPEQCVVSGPDEAITQLEETMVRKNVLCRRLQTSRAFHSAMMDSILESFGTRMSQVALRQPQIPYLSNLTGRWITSTESTDPEYWVRHLRDTVQFSECVTELLRQPGRVMIEIGPGQTLASLVRQHNGKGPGGGTARVFSSLPRSDRAVGDTAHALQTLGELWKGGHSVDWHALHRDESVSRIPLPTYPFQRQRYWIDADIPASPETVPPSAAPRAPAPSAADESADDAASTASSCIDQWFYQRAWQRALRRDAAVPLASCWMVFCESNELSKQLCGRLKRVARPLVVVAAGKRFTRSRGGRYTIRPGVRDDFDALLSDLGRRRISPQKIVHLWCTPDGAQKLSLDDKLDRGFYSLLFLAQALGALDMTGIDIGVVSDRLHSVAGEPVADTVFATLLGPTRVIPKELPGLTCRAIDIDSSDQSALLAADQIIAELIAPVRESVVAIRRGERWIETLQSANLETGEKFGRLRKNGVYLITGGLGDLGLVIAEELAREFQARLVLLGRTPLFPAPDRRHALDSGETADRLEPRKKKLAELESLGAEILYIPCDICQRDNLKQAIATAKARFGAINGVIHAAGVIDDGPLFFKSREHAASVIDPKVKGTLALVDVLTESAAERAREVPLDFIALFSSVSSLAAPAGQVDYTAANAFLNAFAASRRDLRIVAINWDAWRDVGMAARSSPTHPLLGRRLIEKGGEIVYKTSLSRDRHWMLAEHCLKSGQAVLPGTGYLEIASAALTKGSFDQGVSFEDVFFQSPFLAEPTQSREARVDLRRTHNGTFQFSVRTADQGSIEHASGRIERCHQTPPERVAIDAIIARCQSRLITFDETHRTHQERFFDFGPRWRCLKAIHVGTNEALAVLELPDAFAGDISEYHLHPALLDLATGSALYLIADYGPSSSVYFPMYYKCAVVFRKIPGRFFSHIRSRPENEADGDVATFDLTLLDLEGSVLAQIDGFSMRLVRDPRDGLGIVGAHVSPGAARNGFALDAHGRGIAPTQGARAFTRLIASPTSTELYVLPDGPEGVIRHSENAERREISTATLSDQVETVLADWWNELLGVGQVGIDDDFFDLGGHSLLVVRLFSKIKKTYGVTIGLSTFFEARTIRTIAGLIREGSNMMNGQSGSSRAVVPIRAGGTRPALYICSGLDGHVLGFHKMAVHLGEDQPVYGLVPRGLDDGLPYDTRVEEMAAYYVDAIRKQEPNGPYRVAGHSFGGIVAFEVARQLMALGALVDFVGLLDTIERQYVEEVKRSLRFRERFASVSAGFRLAAAQRDPFGPIRRRFYRMTSSVVSGILPNISLPLQNAKANIKDVNIYALYKYKPLVYPGKLTLFRSTTREVQDGNDECLGWGRLAAGGVEVHEVPSTHYNMIDEPAVGILAAILQDCLDRDPGYVNAERALAQI